MSSSPLFEIFPMSHSGDTQHLIPSTEPAYQFPPKAPNPISEIGKQYISPHNYLNTYDTKKKSPTSEEDSSFTALLLNGESPKEPPSESFLTKALQSNNASGSTTGENRFGNEFESPTSGLRRSKKCFDFTSLRDSQ